MASQRQRANQGSRRQAQKQTQGGGSQPPRTRGGSYRRQRPWWSTPWAIGGALAVVALVVVSFVIWSAASGSRAPGKPTEQGTSQVIQQATHVPASVYDAVPPGTTGLKATNPPTVLRGQDGKPELLYVGAEYCPYCAAERWAMVLALSRFGTFSGLALTSSSGTDVYPNTPTFTFRNASYQSSFLTLTTVEIEDQQQHQLQQPTAREQQLMQTYDSGGSIPFLLVGGKYAETGSGYQPDALAGKSWQQIAADLNNPSSPSTRAIVGEANMLTASICQMTGNQPGSVCQSQAVQRAAARLPK